MRTELTLSKRLEAIFSLVPRGATLIDVGTDHAYLPIALILNAGAVRVWASDINSGPLKIAAENISAYGLSDRIALYLSDGLADCRCEENRYDHIVIAGMGGETISAIIDGCEYSKSARPVFILQPMTMQYHLRNYLAENRFEIIKESVVFDDGKYYNIIKTRFSGKKQNLCEFEKMFGLFDKAEVKNDVILQNHLSYERNKLLKIIEGKTEGAIDCSFEQSMVTMIADLIGEV